MKFTAKQLDPWACDLSRGDVQCPFITLTTGGHKCCTWKIGHPQPHEPTHDCTPEQVAALEWVLPASANSAPECSEGKEAPHVVSADAVGDAVKTGTHPFRSGPHSHALIFAVLFVLASLGSARAADPVFKPHYWTVEHKLEVPALLLATAADAYFTHEVLAGGSSRLSVCTPRPGHPDDCMQTWSGDEHDPLARLFVTRGTAIEAGYFAGLSALTVGGSWWLEKHHHEKAADWLLRLQLGSEIGSATYTSLGSR